MSIFDTDKTLHICGVLRCAKYKFNKAFVEKGAIKFSIPQLWANIGKKDGEGRGDISEGMFVTFDKDDYSYAYKFGKKYHVPNDDVIIDIWGNRVFYRRKRTMNLPSFCLYGIKYDLFDIKPQVGRQEVQGTINEEYFTAFSNDTNAEDKTILEEERLSLVYVSNYDLLKERIVSKLKEIGISQEEIIAEPIQYYEPEKYGNHYWYEITSPQPKELLWKRKKFEYQSEIRIIVNSKNELAMNVLRNEVIEIGDLTDIAKISMINFNDKLHIKMAIDILKNDLTN